MAVPTTRQEFKEKCLRRIGKPVLQINVQDDQLEDLIDDALKYYADYHFDATEKTYYTHQITASDISNRYITLPENIIGAVRIFDIQSQIFSSSSLFDLQYQFVMQALYNLNNVQLAPYVAIMQHIDLINQIINGKQPIRYQRHKDRLYIDTNWITKITEGSYIIVEAYQVIDPDVYTDVWGDRWLTRYVAAQFKKQWGTNLLKFDKVQLAGGVTLNGQKMYDEAEAEINMLEASMITDYSEPLGFEIG